MMHHSRQFASFGLVLFWVILTPGVITAVDVGGVYDCNPPWGNGDTVKITFRIDRSQYDSKCDPNLTAGKPVFKTSPDGKVTYGANCTVRTDIRTSCPFISGTIGCGCTNSNDNGFYVVEYNFIFSSDYHRYWEAEIACLESNFAKNISFINNGSNCQQVAQPMTTQTPTTESPPPEPCYLCACREGCKWWCVGCIVIIIFVAGIIVFICICCGMYCCCGTAVVACCCRKFFKRLFGLFDRCLKFCGCGDCIPEDKPKPTCPPANNKPADSACPDGKPDGTCPPTNNKTADSACPDGKPDGEP